VVGVHLINAKGSKLIERDKAESQAMMVMNDDPKLTNFEKRYKDHIFYGSDDSDRGFFLGVNIVAYAEVKRRSRKKRDLGGDLRKSRCCWHCSCRKQSPRD
jgi:hypothetical protein